MLVFLIDLYYKVCHSRFCEGTDEGPIFNKNLWYSSHMVIGSLGDVGSYDFSTNDDIWISDINWDRILYSFVPDTETAFCPTAVLR